MPFEVTVSQKDQTLPMILTLRGDEAIALEFTFDTDQAMHFLGIKRSRLNQISGRELRVARIRRDRYIRPVYRECDLKDYLDWTRATATHLSSSKAIEQAVENLDDRFNDVLHVFNSKLEQVSEDQRSWMRSEFESLPAKYPVPFPSEASSSSEMPWHREDKLLRAQGEKMQELQKTIKALQVGLRDVQAMVTLIIPEMKELSVAQKSLRFDLDQKSELLQAQIRDLAREFTLSALREETFHAEAREYFKPVAAMIDEPPAAAYAPMPTPMIKRRRKMLRNTSRRYGR